MSLEELRDRMNKGKNKMAEKEMTIEKAREIVSLYGQIKGTRSSWHENRRKFLGAHDFIDGWKARGIADRQILNDYPDITVEDLARLKALMNELDTPEGREEKP